MTPAAKPSELFIWLWHDVTTPDNHDVGRAAITTKDDGTTMLTWGEAWPKTKLSIS